MKRVLITILSLMCLMTFGTAEASIDQIMNDPNGCKAVSSTEIVLYFKYGRMYKNYDSMMPGAGSDQEIDQFAEAAGITYQELSEAKKAAKRGLEFQKDNDTPDLDVISNFPFVTFQHCEFNDLSQAHKITACIGYARSIRKKFYNWVNTNVPFSDVNVPYYLKIPNRTGEYNEGETDALSFYSGFEVYKHCMKRVA